MIQNKTKDQLMMNTLMHEGKAMLQLEINSISISDFVKLQEKNTEYNRLKVFLRWKVRLAYPTSLPALQSNIRNKKFKYTITGRLKTPSSQGGNQLAT